MDEYLFSYGTLQKETVQKELFGRVVEGRRDRLWGYKIGSVEIRDPAFLVRGEDRFQRTLIKGNNDADVVEGMVLQLTSAELVIADSYEPENYKRVEVVLGSGKKAWIYVVD